MKIKNKILLFILVLILLACFVSAQPPEEKEEKPDPNIFDPNNPAAFDYVNGDYSTITNWGLVGWDKIPSGRISEVPSGQLNYNALGSEQRIGMTTEQIALNLEKIENLATDVNEVKAREAIEKSSGIKVIKFGEGAKIETGVLKATFGEKGSLDFNSKGGWEVEITDDGRVIIVGPKKIEENVISEKDAFTLKKSTIFTRKDGSEIKVKDLSFKDKQAYVKMEESAIIGDYIISSNNNKIDIFLDKDAKAEGNYVVISDNSLRIGTTKDGILEVSPQPGNKLFNMLKRDYSKLLPVLVASEHDTISLTVLYGDSVDILLRDKDRKTPLMQHHDAGGEFSIETGRMSFSIKKGELIAVPPKALTGKAGSIDMRNSVAFELNSDSPNIKSTLRTASSNRFVQLQDNKQIVGNNQGLEVSDLIETNMIKTVADLKVKYPKMNFKRFVSKEEEITYAGYDPEFKGMLPSDYNDITANMAQITDQWLRDKPHIESYITAINFNTIDNAAASGSEIILGERSMDLSWRRENPIREHQTPFDTLDHEFIHILYKYLLEPENNLITKKIREYQSTPDYTTAFVQYGEEIIAEAEKLPENERERYIERKIKGYDEEHIPLEIEMLPLQKKYDAIAHSLQAEVPKHPDFNTVIDEISDFNIYYLGEKEIRTILLESDDPKWSIKGSGIKELSDYLHFKAVDTKLGPEAKAKAQILETRFNQIIEKQTGMYPYSFKYQRTGLTREFPEVMSTYGELLPERARKNPELAQLEYDQVISVDPPDWLKKKAEDRYNKIMEGNNNFCIQKWGKPCGPCLSYTLICNPKASATTP